MPPTLRSLATCLPALAAAMLTLSPVPAAQAATETAADLRREVEGNPASAPSVITRAFQSGSAVSPHRAFEVTTAVVEGLGSSMTGKQVGAAVHAGVLAAPDRVLEIVRAAVIAAPAEAAEDITTAAVAAVKNPWEMVIYHRAGSPTRRGEPDFKGEPDYKGEPDFKGEPDYKDAGTPMTLAEAIVQTALDARSGLNAVALYAAVELVLRSSPAFQLTAIYNPKGISGVGEAGNNNYANEPFRPRPRVLALIDEPVSP